MHLQLGGAGLEHERDEKIEVVGFEVMVFEKALFGIARNIAIDVKLNKIKHGVEEGFPAGQLLNFRQWITPVRNQLLLGREGLLNELTPGAARHLDSQWQ